jgi:O-antigen/teichoic acid export membrane protein
LGRTGLKANVVFNVVGMSLPVAVALVTVPLYLAHIGAARYGLLSIIWVLLGYLGFADFGLSRAAANALARLTDCPSGERSRVLLTALYANALLGLGGGVIVYLGCGAMIDQVLTLPAALQAEAAGAMPWIAGMVPLTLIGGIARAAIESRERFLVVNLLELVWIVPGQIFPLVAAVWIGPELTVLLPAVFAARLAAVILALGVIVKTEPADAFLIFDGSRLREMLGFGAWVSVSNLIDPLLGTVDQLLVGSALGTAAVAHYAVPMSIVGRSQIVVLALARALFPRFSRLAHQEAKDLAERVVVSLAYAFGGICACVLILGGSFMSLWVGAEFGARATPVIQILMIGAWANGIAIIPYILLQGRQRPDLVAKTHICELVPFVLLLWLLIHQMGVLGAAIAWTLRATADAILLLGFCRFGMVLTARLLPPLALLLAAYAVAQVGLPVLWELLLAVVTVPLFVAVSAMLDVTSRNLLLGLFGKAGQASRQSAAVP